MAMSTTVYGLKNCDTCKKATKWLDRFGVPYTFVDYRDNKPSPEMLLAWAAQLGGLAAMVNKSSTTWRQLPDNRKAADSGGRMEAAAARVPAADQAPAGGHRRRRGQPGFQ
jgi:Spx/MgsR family transcriptional regulator